VSGCGCKPGRLQGELFPSREIREKVGLKPHTRVAYTVEDGRLIVEPLPSLTDLLAEPPEVEISLKDLHRDRRKLSKEIEE
jgi:bifunctional DNA-binding transcriptional regulator/antitoxin component of YhaV-PrlF toxin-antitoxin module